MKGRCGNSLVQLHRPFFVATGYRMPQYDVFLVKPLSGRLSRCYSFDARNDAEAEEFVRGRQTADAIELWFRTRRVARYPQQ